MNGGFGHFNVCSYSTLESLGESLSVLGSRIVEGYSAAIGKPLNQIDRINLEIYAMIRLYDMANTVAETPLILMKIRQPTRQFLPTRMLSSWNAPNL